MQRLELLQRWLHDLFPGREFSVAPASADASFRRYFRISFADGAKPLVVMDAPPTHEDSRPFLHVADLFGKAGAHVPEILETDLEQGFLLLSDLGYITYLAALQAEPKLGSLLYGDATSALVKIQLASKPGELPEYDRALLQRELDLFPEWYIGKHLQVKLSDEHQNGLKEAFDRLLAANLAEPRVYVHRDFHSRNLMWLEGEANPGVLDFQDAVYGPITYDLVSLFKDAYIEWEEEEILDWLVRYWEKARAAGLPVDADFGEFYRAYEWMGVQRHLKVLGIFARLYHRDGKDGYLNDMPLVSKYLRKTVGRYNELVSLTHLLDEVENRQVQVGYTF